MFNPNLIDSRTSVEQDSPLIEVSGLSLELGGRRLLDDISLSSYTCGVTLVMGPNGAGKSLFLRCLHGLVQPTSGRVCLLGQGPSNSELLQAMVFQKATLLRRSVIQNLELLAPPGTTKAEVRALLDSVHLGDKEKHAARILSGGEQQRLALARALLTKPKILFLDEPTASLDPGSVQIIEKLILKAQQSGVKVVFVSHDLGQAKRLASEVIFLHQGKLTEHSDAVSFFSSPKSASAQAYVAGELVL